MLTAFQPTADSPDTMAESLSIIKNGARCGSRRFTCSTSSSVGGEICFASSFIGRPFALPRQLGDERCLLVPFANGARRDTAVIAAPLHVACNARHSSDSSAVADRHVIGDSYFASDDHEVAQHCAPRKA